MRQLLRGFAGGLGCALLMTGICYLHGGGGQEIPGAVALLSLVSGAVGFAAGLLS